MITFDLHYHCNVFRITQAVRKRRLDQQRQAIQRTGVDYIASTEHAYKRPLEAFQYLSDAAAPLETEILPGVEAISAEGVDIIFLFPTEADLTRGLKRLKPFKWSVWETERLGADLGAITIIPHPFTPGKAGIVTACGMLGFQRLLPQADYVELHNGLSLLLLELAKRRPLMREMGEEGKPGRSDYFRELFKKANYTYQLPEHFHLDGLGLSIGSDSHKPGHQWIVGGTEREVGPEGWFSFLKEGRIAFEMTQVQELPNARRQLLRQLFNDLKCSLGEGGLKMLHPVGFRRVIGASSQ